MPPFLRYYIWYRFTGADLPQTIEIAKEIMARYGIVGMVQPNYLEIFFRVHFMLLHTFPWGK